MGLPEFPLPEGTRRKLRDAERSDEARITHTMRVGDITSQRHFAAQILVNAKKIGLRLTPVGGGGSNHGEYTDNNIGYMPRDSKEGKFWIGYRAYVRKKFKDRELGASAYRYDPPKSKIKVPNFFFYAGNRRGYTH